MDIETGKSPLDVLDGKVLASVIEDAPMGFGLRDVAGNVTYVNRFLANLLGFEHPKDVIGREASSLVAEGDREAYRTRLQKPLTEHGDPYSMALRRKDGSELRVLVRPVPILGANGELIASAAFILDSAAFGEPVGSSARHAVDPALLSELTDREQQLFDRLIAGESVREIAKSCSISEHTVRNHIKSIYRKLGLHSRLDIVRAVLGS